MKPFNVNQFVTYIIAGNGWNYNIEDPQKALKEWAKIETNATLYGIRRDGSRCILDSK